MVHASAAPGKQTQEDWPAEIAPRHRAQLEASAISPEVARQRGYRTCADPVRLKGHGFSARQCGPGLLIPWWSVSGRDRPALYQLRRDEPRELKRGPVKYETPAGASNVIDVPPGAREHIGDPAVPLFITEGAKKVDSAVSRGLCSVGLNGVYGWRGRGERGGTAALADWEAIPLRGAEGARRVMIAFDSDVTSKPQVRGALVRLTSFLESRGAAVSIILLPPGPGDAKVGLDDFFAGDGSVDDLLALASDEIPRAEGIYVSRELDVVTPKAWAALHSANNPPTIFRRGSAMIWLRRDEEDSPPRSETMGEDQLRWALARATKWIRIAGEEVVYVDPPLTILKNMLSVVDRDLPALDRVITAPTITADGDVLAAPGYHPSARVYYAPAPELVVPDVPRSPTPADIERGRELIASELLGDFPFVSASDRANCFALVLLPLVRDLVDGKTPLHLLGKPAPGTGASLLVDAISMIATGETALAITEARDEDEWRKRITAALREAPPIVSIDNLRRRLDTGHLSALLTSGTWSDRLLGESTLLRLASRTVWIATANNPQVSTEIARRCLWIAMDAQCDKPHRRPAASFRHPKLLEWVTAHRGELIWSALTLARAWIAAGRPADESVTLGSFEDWARTMGGILRVAGVPGFLDNVEEFFDRADVEGEAWHTFIAAWWDKYDDTERFLAELFELADSSDLNLGDGKAPSRKRKLSYLLRGARDRVFGRHRLTAGEKGKKGVPWRLVCLSGDDGDDGDHVARAREKKREDEKNTRTCIGPTGESSPSSPSSPRDPAPTTPLYRPGDPADGQGRPLRRPDWLRDESLGPDEGWTPDPGPEDD